jgi:hypothetical protein
MKKLSALIALSLLAAPVAYAQDGSSCANAISIPGGGFTTDTDTTGGSNWVGNYGPLASPSNDVVYTFTSGDTAPTGNIVANSASYSFALYLLNSCAANSGATPIGATATVGGTIALTGITAANTQYWLAVTVTAAGGSTANGTANWTINPTYPVSLQSFEIN